MTAGPTRVGVLGLGAMGSGIAAGLAAAGYDVVAHDPAPAATAWAREAGLDVAASPAEAAGAAAGVDVVVLSLPTPAVVGAVVAALAAAGPVRVLDTSTIDPETARAAAGVLRAAGGDYADCPVLGRPASVGSWTFPVGATPPMLGLAQATLGPLARAVVGVGEVGSASVVKLLNNLMLGTINAVTAEALALAEAAGLDPGVFVDVVRDSGAASVSPMFRDVATRAVDGDFSPTFPVRLMHKDNALALALADRHGVPVMAGRAAQTLNTIALAAGHGDEDSIAVIKPLEDLLGRPARRRTPGG